MRTRYTTEYIEQSCNLTLVIEYWADDHQMCQRTIGHPSNYRLLPMGSILWYRRYLETKSLITSFLYNVHNLHNQ